MDVSNIASVINLAMLLLVLMVCQTSTCGPGTRLKSRPTHLNIQGRQPNKPEDCEEASGKFEQPLLRNDSRLQRITSSQIVFADNAYESNCRKAIKVIYGFCSEDKMVIRHTSETSSVEHFERVKGLGTYYVITIPGWRKTFSPYLPFWQPCKEALLRLANSVATFWSKQYKLKVTAGYKEHVSEQTHKKKSLHLEGRAFDLELIDAPGKTRSIRRSTRKRDLLLPTLAGLAYYEAAFTFVKVKQHHIHVSCSKKERDLSTKGILESVFSKCFPSDAYVRNEHGHKIPMNELRTGEKVLTIDSNGNRIYSDVIMMMHRESNVTVTDYVEITTESGHQLTLSSHHLIPIQKLNNSLSSSYFSSTSSSSSKEYIFSKDVQLSHVIFVYDANKKRLSKSRVRTIRHLTKNGAYAPLSLDGTLVVNDVHVSCYALYPSHIISHYVFSIWRSFYRLTTSSFWQELTSKFLTSTSNFSTSYSTTSEELTSTSNGIHWYPNIFRRLINLLPILPYYV